MNETDVPFSGSYDPQDVQFLLKPIELAPIDVAEKERRIQSGAAHYSEMLSPERAPSAAYMDIYQQALAANGPRLAMHINRLADAVSRFPISDTRRGLAIVSLARAGTPIGVLLTRALRREGGEVAHYSVSIIRGRGIDMNALRYILDRHHQDDIVFVDGWTGKGAIAGELRGPMGPSALGIKPRLLVVADPAGVADVAATAQDYLIPSGILNGIVSGLVSRSVLNSSIGPADFHGCVRLNHLAALDVSRAFIHAISELAAINRQNPADDKEQHWTQDIKHQSRIQCQYLLRHLQDRTKISDVNRIKPGIAEATRAVLRRVPERLFVESDDDPDLQHLILLANEKQIPIEKLQIATNFRAVSVIAPIGDE